MATPADPPPKDAAKEAKEAEQAAHYALLEQLDNHSVHKAFRSSTWKPNQRRNKNIKTILGDAQRKEQALLNNTAAAAASSSTAATPTGADTPAAAAAAAAQQHDDGFSTSGASTPATGAAAAQQQQQQPNLAQASRSLGKLVLEKSLKPSQQGGAAATAPVGVTYTNIEAAPSLAPQRRYCDITGLKSNYHDPKTRLRYHNAEVFGLIRGLPQGYAEQYLEARGAHTVLK